jgi:DNA polymerase-3 subunit epsilon
MSIIFFDVETSGLSPKLHSVLSFACIIRDNNEKETIVQRFYYPDPNKEISNIAIDVNGLTDEKISSLRSNDSYPEYFKDDSYIEKIFKNYADLLVGHNVNFDISFIVSAFQNINKKIENTERFCTMKNNKRNGKTLKLDKVCELYKIEIAPGNFHDALWDTKAVKEIYDKMKK